MDGGKKAAVLLVQAVTEELQSRNPFTAHQMQVIVRIYANMQGLAKTYEEMGVLPHSAMFKDFVRGFNMGDTMCDYVDAGNGKECSDEKVKGMQAINYLMTYCGLTHQSHVPARFAGRSLSSNLVWWHNRQWLCSPAGSVRGR